MSGPGIWLRRRSLKNANMLFCDRNATVSVAWVNGSAAGPFTTNSTDARYAIIIEDRSVTMIGMTKKAPRWLAALGLTSALLLGGCAYDDGYGYGGVNVGTGYYGGGSYYDDGYGYGNGWGGGYGYQPSNFGGWYSDYYYPGSGYYVYDRGGKRYRWNDGQRRYWEGRRAERGNDGRGNQWRGRDNDGRGNDGRGNGWRGNDGRNYDRGANGAPGRWRGDAAGRPQAGTRDDGGRGQWRGDGQPRDQGQRAVTPRAERSMGQPGTRQAQPRATQSTPRGERAPRQRQQD
jgi:hypothetical protein